MEEENQEIVSKVIDILKEKEVPIPDSAIEEGMVEKIPGRFQQFGKNIFYDGAHNPHGIKKSISNVFGLLPEGGDHSVTVVCGFTREANLDENIMAVLGNENMNLISSIFFTENSPDEPEMINYQPSWIKLDRIEDLLGDVTHEKLKVLTNLSDGEFEPLGLHSLKEDTVLVPSLGDILGYLEEDPGYKDNYIFIFGTFRLYKDLYCYSQGKE